MDAEHVGKVALQRLLVHSFFRDNTPGADIVVVHQHPRFAEELLRGAEERRLSMGGRCGWREPGPRVRSLRSVCPFTGGDTFERTALLSRGPAMQKGARRFSPSRSFLCFFIG